MVTRKIIAVAVVLVLLASSIAALSLIQVGSKNDDGRVKVVTTFYPLYYFSSQIAGDSASVEMLIPDNVEPHSWGPTASDMISVSSADMFVYNGAGFEPWANDFIDALPSGAVIVDTSRNVQLTLSDEISAVYEQAESYLSSGPFVMATMASLSSTTIPSTEGGTGCLNLTLASNGTQYEGVLILNIAQEGDYRIFFDEDVSISLALENGTDVDLEADLGVLAGHEGLPKALFTEFAEGNIIVKITNATVQSVRMVIVVPEGEGGEEHAHGLNDPHFWIDPLSAKVQVDNILSGLVQVDPHNATAYTANANNLKTRLDQLNSDFNSGLANRTKNDIITTHEGFNYLAMRYGFNDHAAIGISADAQPSAQDLVRLADLVNDLGLKYVFSEPIFNDQIIQQISSSTGTQVLVLDGVHGRAGIHKDMDYFEIMYANLEELKIGLEVE